MNSKLGIVNYGSGNFKSLCNAIDYLDIDWLEITKPTHFEKVSHIILPGVGSYHNCMKCLKEKNLIEKLTYEIVEKRKFI